MGEPIIIYYQCIDCGTIYKETKVSISEIYTEPVNTVPKGTIVHEGIARCGNCVVKQIKKTT